MKLKLISCVSVFIFFQVAVFSQKNGLQNTNPTTALDVSGAVIVRPAYLTISGSSVIIPANIGAIVTQQNGTTPFFIINTATAVAGQKLLIDNTGPQIGLLGNDVMVPFGISEFIYSGSSWQMLTTNNSNFFRWSITGNAKTHPSINFMGNADNNPLSFSINGIEKIKLGVDGLQVNNNSFLEAGTGLEKETNAGKIAYGLVTPQTLDIFGAGTQIQNRKIRFWAEDISTFEGDAFFAQAVGIAATPEEGRLQINGSTVSTASIAIKDSLSDGAGSISFRNTANALFGMDLKVNSTGNTGNLNNLSLNTASNIYNPSHVFYGNGHTDIKGKIVIADDTIAPVTGTIRFNSTTKDFEGYTGSAWVSMTIK